MMYRSGSQKSQKMLMLLLITLFLSCMIVVYCWVLLTFAVAWWDTEKILGKIMAAGIVIIPLLGIWVLARTLYVGYAIQQLSRRVSVLGLDVDGSHLRKRPSGRILLEDADALFFVIKQEWEADPEGWISNYRLAKAYDYAGDRTRARKMMNIALKLEKNSRKLAL